jgi:coenzyme F420-reducing hydrogenase gamma subunit
MPRRPKLGVFSFTSCGGCQLALLDCEDALLDVAGAVQIAYFPEASRAEVKGPYDVALVEGSMSAPRDSRVIQEVRAASKVLVALGACATSGGIQALKNFQDVKEFLRLVYPNPEQVETLPTSTSAAVHVKVDYELRGCPVNKAQLVDLLGALLTGRRPNLRPDSTCLECKRLGTVCVMVASGTPCLGPVTHAGCGALCPSHARGCYACFGPKERPNTRALGAWWRDRLSVPEPDTARAFRTYNANAVAFREEAAAHA